MSHRCQHQRVGWLAHVRLNLLLKEKRVIRPACPVLQVFECLHAGSPFVDNHARGACQLLALICDWSELKAWTYCLEPICTRFRSRKEATECVDCISTLLLVSDAAAHAPSSFRGLGCHACFRVLLRCPAGAGLAETEHMFFYPERDVHNFAVTQFVSADLGQTGLANTVKEVAEQSIKVGAALFWQSCLVTTPSSELIGRH